MPRTALKVAAVVLLLLLASSELARRRERAAVEAFSRRARFDWASPASGLVARGLRAAGIEWFDHVVQGTVHGYRFSSADGEALKSLSHLRHLKLDGFVPTGRGSLLGINGVVGIEEVPSLETLEMTDFPFQKDSTLMVRRCPNLQSVLFDCYSASLARFSDLPALQKLNFRRDGPIQWGRRRTPLENLPRLQELKIFRDDGLIDGEKLILKNLPALEFIDVQQVPMSAVDFSELPSLKYLEIRTTKFNDDGVLSLRGLHNVTGLRLVICDITDVGLDRLDDLPALELLDVRYTNVSSEGLGRLNRFPGLRTIITSLVLSADQLQELHRALPGVIIKIERYPFEPFEKLKHRVRY
jgi:hypothetical protein